MIIAALAWLYVIGMIALTVGSAARGIATFLVVGVLPLAFIVWILGRRVRKRSVLDQRLHRSDGADAQGDEQHLLQGGGRAVRGLLYIDDAVAGLLCLGEKAAKVQGEIFNISSGQPLTTLAIAQAVIAAAGARGVEPEIVDQDPGATSIRYSSPEKMRRSLGWAPVTTLEQGLAAVIAWQRHANACSRPPIQAHSGARQHG